MVLPPIFDPIVNAPKPQKIVLGVLGLATIVAAAYFLVLSPLEIKVDQLRTQNEAKDPEARRVPAGNHHVRAVRLAAGAEGAALRARAIRAAGRVVSASLVTVPAACSGTPAPAPPANPPAAGAAAGPLLPAVPPVPEAEVPKYEAKGRRDPFEALDAALGAGGGGSLVTTAKLTGIVRSGRGTLALVETPEGIGYILKTGDTLGEDRKSTRLNSSHLVISYAVFCLKKKKK